MTATPRGDDPFTGAGQGDVADWQAALALFRRLIDVPESGRAAVLSRSGASSRVRRLATRLLAAERGRSVLDAPLPLLADRVGETGTLEGRRLGRWLLTGLLGRGGMSVVYRARSLEAPVGQQAAVKLLSLAAATPDGRERFEREIAILTRLRHPGIAPVHDAGIAEDGTPWFSMGLVEGMDIGNWCRQRGADAAQCVELFLQVCAAVEHAHRHLVIHRDLKPSNVLVDGEGRAVLLDFGISRLQEEGAGDATASGAYAFTPRYAAPEQMHGGAITTATDVFGLGSLLHLLLTGQPPPRVDVAGGIDGPAPPAPATDRKSLPRLLAGDLGTILRKAVATDPGQRYPDVGSLADDLSRWLHRRPISARAPSLGYRIGRFVARNRWQTGFAVLAALALLAGMGGTTWQAQRARAAAEEAQAQLVYLGDLLEILAPSTAEARELDRSRLIAEAARRARAGLAARAASLASVELALARVADGVGDYPQAQALADSALGRRQRLLGKDALAVAEARVVAAGTRIRTARFEDALRLLQPALAVLHRKAPGSPLLVEALQQQAAAYGDLHRYEEQEASVGEAIALCEGPVAGHAACEAVWLEQGSTYSIKRQSTLAIPPLERAHAARRMRLGDEHAQTLEVAGVLSWAYAQGGQLARGLALAEQVHAAYLRIYAQPTETSLRAMMRLSRLAARSYDAPRALALIDDYLAQSRELLGEAHPATVLGHSDKGSLLYFDTRFREAADQFAIAARGYRALPGGGDAINAAITEGFRADALREMGRAAEALPLQRASVATLERSYADGEHVMLARALTNLARTEAALGDFAQALADHERSIAMHRKLQPDGDPGAAHAAAFRARTLLDMGGLRDAEAELRMQLRALQRTPDIAPHLYWEPYAFLVEAACRNGAADCPPLRTAAEAALRSPLPSLLKLRLRHTLQAHDRAR